MWSNLCMYICLFWGWGYFLVSVQFHGAKRWASSRITRGFLCSVRTTARGNRLVHRSSAGVLFLIVSSSLHCGRWTVPCEAQSVHRQPWMHRRIVSVSALQEEVGKGGVGCPCVQSRARWIVSCEFVCLFCLLIVQLFSVCIQQVPQAS